jgi:hypothetical protein
MVLVYVYNFVDLLFHNCVTQNSPKIGGSRFDLVKGEIHSYLSVGEWSEAYS